MKEFFIFLAALLGLVLGVYLWVDQQSQKSVFSESNLTTQFEIKDGVSKWDIGDQLAQQNLIKNKYYFYYFVWKNKANKMQAGVYEIAPNQTIGQMVEKFSKGEIVIKTAKLTIPEGFTNKKIIARLRESRPLLADEFESIVSCQCINLPECQCDRFSEKYSFLKEIPKNVDMEGFLFPDTYNIEKEDTGATLVSKFLNNFEKKITLEMETAIKEQKKSLYQIITMASLIEKEAQKDEDKKIVAGVFWQRIKDQHPLQSCATLAYITGQDKEQFSLDDTKIESPYNTYLNAGLPVGPVSNPGLSSINAAIYPTDTDFYFFLTDPETKEMIYSKTGTEHEENKGKHGL